MIAMNVKIKKTGSASGTSLCSIMLDVVRINPQNINVHKLT